MAERWLKENIFYFGRRRFFKNEADCGEWIHANDRFWKYEDVEITEQVEDDLAESEYIIFQSMDERWMYCR